MRSRWKRRLSGLSLVLTVVLLRADPGDVENSRDYPGFPRLPGFVISDYNEDNPSEFTFSVSRPRPIDAGRIETITVKGHRYVIRYELGSDGKPTTVLNAQKAYEKLAADAGYTVQKTGAVGDVTETFYAQKGDHDVWICLEPSATVNVVTVVEAKAGSATPPPAYVAAKPKLGPGPALVPPPDIPPPPPAAPAKKTAVIAPATAAPTQADMTPVEKAPPPVPKPPPPAAGQEDAFYVALMKNGRVVLPVTFLPGKPDLDADSQDVIDRVAAIMRQHPELRLEVQGHTDNSGNAQANQRLSEQRAITVKGMLVADKVDRRRLTTVGLGGTQPVAKGDTSEARDKNRRIELVLRKDNAPVKAALPTKDQARQESKPIVPEGTEDTNSTAFHPTAPNGTNYYPAGH